MTHPNPAPVSVFLGGACNPTTWRQDTAIPYLEERGISYFNPQVDDWSEELVAIEAQAKATASLVLFVITPETAAAASLVEATELAVSSSARVVIAITGDIPDGILLEGARVEGRVAKDLNRARVYLKDVANRHGVALYGDLESALAECVERLAGGPYEPDLNANAHRGTSEYTPTPGTTQRGFSIIRFLDRYGQECSLQESSLATEPAVWLGVGAYRMHLSQSQAFGIAEALEAFSLTDRLPPTA